jgi:hypothetical protein
MDRVLSGRLAIAEAAGTSTPVVDGAIRAGHLETFVVGRKRKARESAVQKWIEFLQAESHAGRPVKYRARSRVR